MNSAFDKYSVLIGCFLSRHLSAQEFSNSFLELFKKETEPLGEQLFPLLDELFGDAESFTNDSVLLAEDPDFYLDETSLEARARDILHRMQVWHGQQSSLRNAAISNPDLPVGFIGDVMASMAEPREDAVPFTPRGTRNGSR